MKITMLLLATLTLAGMQLRAQDRYKVMQDTSGKKMLVGQIDEKLLANDASFAWFYRGVNNYTPDPKMIKYISAYRDSFNVVAVVGTWCPDSQRLLPEFYRVMLASSYPTGTIQLYAVDRNMKALNGEISAYNIERTPTFIIFHNGKEVGRIVESVKKNMETDIVMILDKMAAEDEGAQN